MFLVIALRASVSFIGSLMIFVNQIHWPSSEMMTVYWSFPGEFVSLHRQMGRRQLRHLWDMVSGRYEGPQIANLELVVTWTSLITLPAVNAKVQIAKVFFFSIHGYKKRTGSPSVESVCPSLSLTPILSSFTRLSVRLCVFCAAL